MTSLRTYLSAALISAPLQMSFAQAPVMMQDACRTADACLAETTAALARRVPGATTAHAKSQDWFYWFGRINMASTVVNVDIGIIPPALDRPYRTWGRARDRPRQRARRQTPARRLAD